MCVQKSPQNKKTNATQKYTYSLRKGSGCVCVCGGGGGSTFSHTHTHCKNYNELHTHARTHARMHTRTHARIGRRTDELQSMKYIHPRARRDSGIQIERERERVSSPKRRSVLSSFMIALLTLGLSSTFSFSAPNMNIIPKCTAKLYPFYGLSGLPSSQLCAPAYPHPQSHLSPFHFFVVF